MPAIWNVGNSNGIDNKKMSSKLTFEVGESFKGKIISEDSSNGVVVKLINGWEFSAEIVGEESIKENSLLKFQVEGFENGKLKLKLVQDTTGKNNNPEGDIIGEFIKNEGLLKTDEDILNAMVKFKIPLTRENISFVKSLLSFNGKVNKSEGEIKSFIDNYILAKGIDENSLEAGSVRENLNSFFESYKTLSEDDILLFLENNIDINKENIDSYNKIFKSEDGFKEFFQNISKEVSDLNLPRRDISDLSTNTDFKDEKINNKPIENKVFKPTSNQINALKIYDANNFSKAKISMVSLLRSLGNSENEVIKNSLKNIVIDNKDNFTNSELKSIFNKLDNLTEDDIFKAIKSNLPNNEGLSKENISRENIDKVISNIIGKNINLSDEVSEKFKEVLEFKLIDNLGLVIENQEHENVQSNNLNIQDNNSNMQENNLSEKVVDTLKDMTSIESDKLPEQNEFNTSKVDAKLENTKIVKQDVEKIIGNELKDLSSETIKDDIKLKLDDIKEILRDTLSRTQISSEHGEKIMNFIKSNLNDFKLLNSINNEYYYLDIPVNTNNQEYPCKLIIKDNRKGNKGIDRSNVRVVVAVKTLNLGTVDGYLTVKDKSLNVELKCNSEVVNIIDVGTSGLASKLQDLGYLVNISVSKKDEEVSLTTCRSFFNDINTSAIDTKV